MPSEPEKRHLIILSVEDNAADARLILELLKTAEMSVRLHVVHDGAEALDFLFHRHPFEDAPRPDLILLDLTIPKISGQEVLGIIKGDPGIKQIPVLILTGSQRAEDVSRCYELHANTYIVKPFDLAELSEVMKGIERYWLNIAELPPQVPRPRSEAKD